MKLFINQDVIIVNNKIEGEIFLYNRRKRVKSLINEDMFNILNHIFTNDGITLDELSKEFKDIEDVIMNLLELEILKSHKQKRLCNIKKVEKIDTARIFAEITDKCNLRCKHCYGNFKIENFTSLDIDSLKSLINQAKENGVYQFDLTGGEPLLYSNLEELLKQLYEAGMLVTIFTNLTILNDKIMHLLDLYCVKKLIVSLDSSSEKVHDEFRGVNGAFKKTIHHINKLKKTGIELSINTMVGNHNKDNIEDTINFIKELDLPCVLDAIVPSGRANGLNEDIFSSVQTIHDLYMRDDLNVDLKITDCGVGKRFVYIKSNGNVCLCPSLTTEKFIFGNIYDKDFNLIRSWKTMSEKYGNLYCKKNCSKKQMCNGGCRARALMFENNIYGADINSCILSGEC